MPEFPLRVALIGCGTISRILYRPALKSLEERQIVRVVALSDTESDNFAAFRDWFPDAEYGEQIARSADMAIVATPPAAHPLLVQHWLSRGVGVLCEKPLAPDVASCEQIVSAAAAARAPLAVGHVRRFYPAAEAIRSLIVGGEYGEVVAFRFVEGTEFAWPIRSDTMFRKGNHGGVLLDIGVHLFDLMRFWFGDGFDIFYEDDAFGGVEANCRGYLRRETLEGEFRLSRETETQNSYWFVLERAAIRWNPAEPSRFSLLRKNAAAIEHIIVDGDRTFEQCFTDQLVDLAGSIRDRRPPRVSAADGLAAVEWVERCYRERQNLPTDWMSDEEQRAVAALS